jgi:antitoxin component of MazEF toxin-antitoxin module
MKGMAMRVERRGDEYCVVLSKQVLEALQLTEGAEVEVRPVEANGASEPDGIRAIRHLSVEETLEAFRETLPQHRDAYRELAK